MTTLKQRSIEYMIETGFTESKAKNLIKNGFKESVLMLRASGVKPTPRRVRDSMLMLLEPAE